jgi:hypothetical protein
MSEQLQQSLMTGLFPDRASAERGPIAAAVAAAGTSLVLPMPWTRRGPPVRPAMSGGPGCR